MTKLAWVDIETTGFDPRKGKVLEVACVVTDDQLEVLGAIGFVINQNFCVVAQMDEWAYSTHLKSGLIDQVLDSSFNEESAQDYLLEFLSSHMDEGTSPMCGNSIWFDRAWLKVHMPRFERFFHYRNIDVSTVKLLAQMWQPAVYECVSKANSHTALQDIMESIDELKVYKERWLTYTYYGGTCSA